MPLILPKIMYNYITLLNILRKFLAEIDISRQLFYCILVNFIAKLLQN